MSAENPYSEISQAMDAGSKVRRITVTNAFELDPPPSLEVKKAIDEYHQVYSSMLKIFDDQNARPHLRVKFIQNCAKHLLSVSAAFYSNYSSQNYQEIERYRCAYDAETANLIQIFGREGKSVESGEILNSVIKDIKLLTKLEPPPFELSYPTQAPIEGAIITYHKAYFELLRTDRTSLHSHHFANCIDKLIKVYDAITPSNADITRYHQAYNQEVSKIRALYHEIRQMSEIVEEEWHAIDEYFGRLPPMVVPPPIPAPIGMLQPIVPSSAPSSARSNFLQCAKWGLLVTSAGVGGLGVGLTASAVRAGLSAGEIAARAAPTGAGALLSLGGSITAFAQRTSSPRPPSASNPSLVHSAATPVQNNVGPPAGARDSKSIGP